MTMPLILDLTRLLPGPLATQMLSAMGYRVLRLVPPAGDLLATAAPDTYAWLNAGKIEETVDLKSTVGRERLQALVAEAAALVETNRPGVMEKLGVGPDELRRLNPKLVYVRLAGYRDPASRTQPGHDATYLAADGLLERFDPAWRSVQLADSTGAFWAVIALLEGLRQGGGFFEVYLSETARAVAYPPVAGLDGSVLCYSVYPTAQGQLVLAALEPHLWQKFCHTIEQSNWLPEQFSPANASNPVWRELCATFAQRSAAEWEAWANQHHLPLRQVVPATIPREIVPW